MAQILKDGVILYINRSPTESNQSFSWAGAEWQVGKDLQIWPNIQELTALHFNNLAFLRTETWSMFLELLSILSWDDSTLSLLPS